MTENNLEAFMSEFIRSINGTHWRTSQSRVNFVEDNPPRLRELNRLTVIEVPIMIDHEYAQAVMAVIYKFARSSDWCLYPGNAEVISIAKDRG